MRRWLNVTAILAAAALFADTLLWLAASRILAAQAARWAARAQTHGWIVSSGERSAGGWPLAATLAIDRAGIAGGEHILPGGLAWSADRVVLSVSLSHPFTLRVSAEGQQFLRVSHLQDLGFTAAQAVIRLPLLGRTQARLVAAAVSGGIAGSRHPQDVQIAALSVLAQQDAALSPRSGVAPMSVTRVAVQANGIGLPDIGRWPLGATIVSAAATLALSSPMLPGQPAGTGEVRAAAWRDGGGVLRVDDAKLRWGPLAVGARCTLGLDDGLQPLATGTADITGASPALDAAARAGLISPGQALAMQAVLAVMNRAPGPDGTQAARLPFLVRDSVLSVGGISIIRLPAVNWHGPAATP